MKEQMINEIAKEAYESCFKDIYEMSVSNNEMMNTKNIEELVKSQVKAYQAKKQFEDAVRKDITKDAKEAYINVFGNEEAKAYPSYNSYNEWMESKSYLMNHLNSLK